jgi:hypothetical protein
MAALKPYSNPLSFTLTLGARPGPFSTPLTFTLDPDPPASTGNPYSNPYFWEQTADVPVAENPYSNPYTFTLTGVGRPGPFSDPCVINTRSQVWFMATDSGWVVAEMRLLV